MNNSGSTTSILQQQMPPRETRFADTVEYHFKARLLCLNTDSSITSVNFNTLLSTGDPYSVVLPFYDEMGRRIIFEEISTSFTPTWFGAPCIVVKVWMGLYVVESPYPRPFTMLALLPLDPDSIPSDLPPLLRLGAHFLHSNNAEVILPFSKDQGRLIIPY